MKYSVETITPDVARQMLESGSINRTPSSAAIKRLSEEMKSGTWVLNGDWIRISSDNKMFDGQHRLLACIQANVPFTTFVMRDCDEEAIMKSLDIGRKRSFADYLTFKGYKNTRNLGAMVRGLAIWRSGSYNVGSGNEQVSHLLSFDNLYRVLESNSWLDEQSHLAQKVSTSVHIPVSIFAALFSEFDQLDPSDNVYFWEQLSGDIGHEKGDPIYVLRKTFLSHYANKIKKSDKERLGMVIKAWNAFRGGEHISHIRFAPGGARPEKFPAIV